MYDEDPKKKASRKNPREYSPDSKEEARRKPANREYSPPPVKSRTVPPGNTTAVSWTVSQRGLEWVDVD